MTHRHSRLGMKDHRTLSFARRNQQGDRREEKVFRVQSQIGFRLVGTKRLTHFRRRIRTRHVETRSSRRRQLVGDAGRTVRHPRRSGSRRRRLRRQGRRETLYSRQLRSGQRRLFRSRPGVLRQVGYLRLKGLGLSEWNRYLITIRINGILH